MQLASPFKIVDKVFTFKLPDYFRNRAAEEHPAIKSLSNVITVNEDALYAKAGELYLQVRDNLAGSDNYCVQHLARWIADQNFSEDELTSMKSVFLERWEKNNEGSARGGALYSSLCSEGYKYRWILKAIAEALI